MTPPKSVSSEDRYETMYSVGHDEELLQFSLTQAGVEARYWEINALIRLGELDNAHAQSVKHESKFDEPLWRCKFLGLQTSIHTYEGKFDKAIQKNEEAHRIALKIKNEYEIARSLHRLGFVYQLKGEYDKALTYLEQSAEIFQKNSYKAALAWSLHNIGKIYRWKQNLEKAFTYHDQSYKIRLELKNQVFISYSLFHLIDIELFKDRKSARLLLSKLESIANTENNLSVSALYNFASALLFKSSKRIQDKVKSQSLLESVIKTKEIYLEKKLEAILHLIELLLMEYQSYNEEEVLEEEPKEKKKGGGMLPILILLVVVLVAVV
ncbi:MAG: tetratricopeptide repeat protein, partial [Candidatus Heimdallarchaeota archaeon]|nr:tetratricopeptide repeat protein [Candidatus Heimdallarchaeota archaeon]